MLIAVDTSSQTLLDYATDTQPSPLTVSPATGTPVNAALTFVVSNGTRIPIWLEELVISFEISDIAQALASDGQNISVSAAPSATWDAKVISNKQTLSVRVSPAKGQSAQVTTDGLSVHIFGIPVNKQPGVAIITLSEKSSTDGKTFSSKAGTIELGKFPYGFYFNNFRASATAVANGATVDLTWNGAEEAQYFLTYGTNPPVNVTKVRKFTTKPLTADADFSLRATVSEHGQTTDSYLSTSVSVTNPDLTAKQLTVSDTTTLQGAATANSSLLVKGVASFASLNVGGTAQILSGNPRDLNPGSYTTNTDGLLLGYVGYPDSTRYATAHCRAWMNLHCYNRTFGITGGNILFPGGGGSAPSFGLLPVQKNAQFSVAVIQSHLNAVEAPTRAVFYPLGHGTLGNDIVVERIGDAPDYGDEAPRSVSLSGGENPDALQAVADAVAQMVPGGAAPDRREALEAALAELLGRR